MQFTDDNIIFNTVKIRHSIKGAYNDWKNPDLRFPNEIIPRLGRFFF